MLDFGVSHARAYRGGEPQLSNAEPSGVACTTAEKRFRHTTLDGRPLNGGDRGWTKNGTGQDNKQRFYVIGCVD